MIAAVLRNVQCGISRSFKVVRYSFPQSKAIHTQTALKMKNENLLTKLCERPTVYMP